MKVVKNDIAAKTLSCLGAPLCCYVVIERRYGGERNFIPEEKAAKPDRPVRVALSVTGDSWDASVEW